MKNIVNTSPNLASDGIVVSEMGVSSKKIQRLLGYVRDNIYLDKERAVVQEYASNAVDEHHKFNVKQPVQIGIRQVDSGYEYFVRDYAKGLSDFNIRNLFAMSGESTKDETNDYIGGWGLGTKVGVSYGDSFL